jgi:hypothetical protein
MRWLSKKFGYRLRQFSGSGFSVRVEPIEREAVSVIYTRQEKTLHLDAQRIGKKREAIEVHISHDVDPARAAQIARDLEAAFQAMDYGYVIARLLEVEAVPDAEIQAAIAELRQIGYELDISLDRKQIRQKWIPGMPKPSPESIRNSMPRYLTLLQTVRGTRQRFEILARSKEFER